MTLNIKWLKYLDRTLRDYSAGWGSLACLVASASLDFSQMKLQADMILSVKGFLLKRLETAA